MPFTGKIYFGKRDLPIHYFEGGKMGLPQFHGQDNETGREMGGRNRRQ
jgi:hypothetical protein